MSSLLPTEEDLNSDADIESIANSVECVRFPELDNESKVIESHNAGERPHPSLKLGSNLANECEIGLILKAVFCPDGDSSTWRKVTLQNLDDVVRTTLAIIDREELKEVRNYMCSIDITEPQSKTLRSARSSVIAAAKRIGRIGPPYAKIDTSISFGTFLCRQRGPGYDLESVSTFSSIRANVAVFSGKWMYEILVNTPGIMQLGWSTLATEFTHEKGTGDSADSYAFDGKRVRKWNNESAPYGESWCAGDTIGVCIDLDSSDNKSCSFYRNGKCLGVAFTGIRVSRITLGGSQGIAYFPSISISQRENCSVNFGDCPFMYPVDGYLPLNPPPSPAVLLRSKYLLESFSRVGSLPPSVKHHDRVILAARIIEHLIPSMIVKKLNDNGTFTFSSSLDGRYIVSAMLLPLLLTTFLTKGVDFLNRQLELLFVNIEPQEASILVPILIHELACKCRTAPVGDGGWEIRVPINEVDLGVGGQWRRAFYADALSAPNPYDRRYAGFNHNLFLELAAVLLAYPPILEIWLSTVGSEDIATTMRDYWPHNTFAADLEDLFSTHQSSFEDLINVFPEVWWKGSINDPEVASEVVMMQRFSALRRVMYKNEIQHFKIANIFLSKQVPLGCWNRQNSTDANIPSTLFIKWVRSIVDAPRGRPRISRSPLESTYKSNLLFALLKVLQPYFLDVDSIECFPAAKLFTDEVRESMPRIAGLMSHIRKNIALRVDEDKDAVAIDNEGDLAPFDTATTTSTTPNTTTTTNNNDSNVSLECRPSILDTVFDLCVSLFQMGVASDFKRSSQVLQDKLRSCTELEEIHLRLETMIIRAGGINQLSIDNPEFNRLRLARQNSRNEVIENVRISLAYRAYLHSIDKQEDMFSFCLFLMKLLSSLSKRKNLNAFQYTPEVYIETFVDCFHGLRRADPPFPMTDTARLPSLTLIIRFLTDHFSDARISNPDVKDFLLQSVSVLLQYREYCVRFEEDSFIRNNLMSLLLNAFNGRFWILITNIILRFWKSTGFGEDDLSRKRMDCASPVFQMMLQKLALDNEKIVKEFLNKVFNNLNWTLTEFTISMQEIQSHIDALEASRTPYTPAKDTERKCNIMFELSVNLLRILELLTREAPQIFITTDGSDVQLFRLLEVCMFYLTRTTTGAASHLFQKTVELSSVGLEGVARGAVLGPIVGVLLNLHMSSPNEDTAVVVSSVDPGGVTSVSSPTRASSRIVNCMLNQPSYADDVFDFVANFDWEVSASPPVVNQFKSRLMDLVHLLSMLKVARSEQLRIQSSGLSLHNDSRDDEDTEDNICSICCDKSVEVSFVPCRHRSCRRCIARQLLNNDKCFFCNSEVVSTEDLILCN